MKKVLFLINPVSGKLDGRSLARGIVLELSGVIERDSYDIEYSGKDIEKQCKGLLSNYEIIVVAGGDGTISQVIKVITRLGNKPKLGIIPIGTGNDLANSLGVLHVYRSQGLGALLKIILKCKVAKLDILSLDNNFIFANYIGIGSDAKISCDFNRLRYKPFFRFFCGCTSNKAFYGLLVLKNIFYRIPFEIEVRYTKQNSKAEALTIGKGMCQILITNTKSYAGGINMSTDCKIDDGKFEVTVIRGMREWMYMLIAMLKNKPLSTMSQRLIHFQANTVELRFTGDTFCQVDGEKYNSFSKGEKRLFVEVASSCEIIVP